MLLKLYRLLQKIENIQKEAGDGQPTMKIVNLPVTSSEFTEILRVYLLHTKNLFSVRSDLDMLDQGAL